MYTHTCVYACCTHDLPASHNGRENFVTPNTKETPRVVRKIHVRRTVHVCIRRTNRRCRCYYHYRLPLLLLYLSAGSVRYRLGRIRITYIIITCVYKTYIISPRDVVRAAVSSTHFSAPPPPQQTDYRRRMRRRRIANFFPYVHGRIQNFFVQSRSIDM